MKKSETWILPLLFPFNPQTSLFLLQVLIQLWLVLSLVSGSNPTVTTPPCDFSAGEQKVESMGPEKLERTPEHPLLQLLLLLPQNIFPHLLEYILYYLKRDISFSRKGKKKKPSTNTHTHTQDPVTFKPMVICEAAGQKMYWLLTLVLAAKLVINGTCYFKWCFHCNLDL